MNPVTPPAVESSPAEAHDGYGGVVDGARSSKPAPIVPPGGPHGGDGAAVAAALGLPAGELLDLSVSLNPYAPDVTALVSSRLDALRRYPDPHHATEALAGALGVPPDRVLLTNGGSEAIALVCADLGRAAVARPGDFSLYARHLRDVADPAAEPEAPLIRSNPHNPSGRLASPTERAAVWDEAFYPLATGAWTRGDPEAVVVGSLTKVFACPGLRVGYVCAPDPERIERLAKLQPRWALNGLASALVPELFERADLPAWRDAIAQRRSALAAALPGVAPSEAAFVLVDAPEGAARTRERLARRGVLVRDCTSFGLPYHVRVAVPDEDGLCRLVAAWEQPEGRS